MKHALFLLAFAIAFVVAQNETTAGNGVMSVSGTGKASVQSRYAAISLSIQADAVTAREASAQVSNASVAVMNALTPLNVTKLQTTNYYLNAKYEYQNNTYVQVGYTATLSLSFQIILEDAGMCL